MARQVRGRDEYQDRVDASRRRVERLRTKKGGGGPKKPPKAHKTPAKPYKRPAKADAPPELQHPPCAVCRTPAVLTTGAVVYPGRVDLADKYLWRCPTCPNSYVGTHAGGDGKQSLGRPADAHLRRARQHLKELVNDLWVNAENMPDYFPFVGNAWQVRSSQRVRVYAYIRVKMGLQAHEAHVGWMDLDQCRACWRLLQHLKPTHIRAWWKAGGEAEFNALEGE